MAYTIKQGDTLSGIAAGIGATVADILKLNPGITNPDKISAGAALNLPTAAAAGATAAPALGPTTTDIGVGKLTTIPKNPIAAAPANDPITDLSGAYARTGITPPTSSTPATDSSTPATPATPAIPGLPTYPTSSQKSVIDAYTSASSALDAAGAKVAAAETPTADELALQDKANTANANVNKFDVETLAAEEALHGQGRGATLGTIGTQTTVVDRTRALQRLGLATEAATLATQLSTAQDNRKNMGDLATTEYNLASKKLDMALGLQDEIDKLNQNDQDNARQYLLDVVNFAAGKNYTQLDAPTQTAITAAVANSPITLDMVKTALTSAQQKAEAADQGRLYSVSGLGVVEINQDGSGYKVVVPEVPTSNTNNSSVPTFSDYVAQQNIPLPELTQDKLKALQSEYDTTYGAGNSINLGKLSPTDKNSITQAGLDGSTSAVQSYFLNTPPSFQQSFARDKASGKYKTAPTLDDIDTAYQAWYATQQNGAVDWNALLNGGAT